MSDLVQWDAIRAVNLALAVLALTGMAWRRPFFRQQDPPVRLLLMVLTVLIFTAAYGTTEVLVTNPGADGGARVMLVSVALILTNAALLRARPARLRPLPHRPKEQ